VILVDLSSMRPTSSMVGITIRVAFSFRCTATTTIRVAIPSYVDDHANGVALALTLQVLHSITCRFIPNPIVVLGS
jgi:hypothetical protein